MLPNAGVVRRMDRPFLRSNRDIYPSTDPVGQAVEGVPSEDPHARVDEVDDVEFVDDVHLRCCHSCDLRVIPLAH
mgnify:FL=1